MSFYYFKHLCRTVKKRPAQPILIVLILSLSFLLVSLVISAENGMARQSDRQNASKYGNADFTVSTALTSPSRFLFAEDVKEGLPDATVTGTFTMPFLSGETFVRGVAVSFDTVSEVFSLTFSEYRAFYVSERSRVAFVSSDFAKANALSLGDSLTLEAFGHKTEYRITGISDAALPGDCDVMVDITGAVNAILNGEPLGAWLPSGFAPFGTLYVKVNEGTDRTAAEAWLRTRFSADTVYDTSTPTASSAKSSLRAISTVVVLLTLICAFSVVFCCSYCMAKERAADAALFATAGVSSHALFRFRLIEMAIYAAVGCLIGTLASLPLGPLFFRTVGIGAVRYRMTFTALLFGTFTVFAVSLLSPLFTGTLNRAKKQTRIPVVFPVLLLLVGAALYVFSFFVRNSVKYYFSLALLILLFTVILLFTPPLFLAFSSLVSRIKFPVAWRTGTKNANRTPAIRNSARLLLIVVTIVSVAFVAVFAGAKFVETLPRWIRADYAVTGGTARVESLLTGTDEVGGLYGFVSEETAVGGKPILTWSVSDADLLDPLVGFDRRPSGFEAITSRAYAAKYDLKKGDTFSLSVGSQTHDVTLVAYADAPLNTLFIDAEAFGVPYSVWFVRAAEGVEKEDLYRSVTTALAFESAVVVPASFNVEREVHNNTMYVVFGNIVTSLLVLFALIGIIDNLADSYRSRKEEIALFRVAGMSRRRVGIMILSENVCGLAFSLLCAIPCVAIAVSILREGLYTFGSDILYFFTH